jgi:hypothetical protein
LLLLLLVVLVLGRPLIKLVTIVTCLPGKSAGQVCRASLPGKSAGQVCRASLPGKSAGQVCRASLPGKTATKDCWASPHVQKFHKITLFFKERHFLPASTRSVPPGIHFALLLLLLLVVLVLGRPLIKLVTISADS